MPLVIQHRCPQDHPCPCVRLCPVDAVSQKGYAAPQINKDRCIECGACIGYCPYQAITERNTDEIKKSSLGA